jgi:hypothetical protein
VHSGMIAQIYREIKQFVISCGCAKLTTIL